MVEQVKSIFASNLLRFQEDRKWKLRLFGCLNSSPEFGEQRALCSIVCPGGLRYGEGELCSIACPEDGELCSIAWNGEWRAMLDRVP